MQAAGKEVDVYGMPSPNFADFDLDDDLDLLCGEFMDGFTYFQNTGTRTKPVYAAGKRLEYQGKDLAMNVQMITPTAVDWDRDGDIDLICGDEDGRVAFIENRRTLTEGVPQFLPPKYFKQEAEYLKFGALATPVSVDWDADGDEDIICGNTAGHIGFIENLDGGNPPCWAPPVRLQAGGKELRIQAGPKGSIQGPCEAKWGYTTLDVADWNHDGLLDLIVNSIWGKVVWYRNIGTKDAPRLAASQPIKVEWTGAPPKPEWNWWTPKGKELATQWRTTPCVEDWDKDGLNDLIMLDHTGVLTFFQRQKQKGELQLLPGKHIFSDNGFGKPNPSPLVLTSGKAGKSGRRKLSIVDWDADGKRDIIVNSTNANLLKNIGSENGKVLFQDMGKMGQRKLAGHTSSPTTVDWNGDGKRDLLLGAEDGFFYYLKNDGIKTSLRTINWDTILIQGFGFEPGILANGEKAFSNRNYVWEEVPQEINGWRCTRVGGGETATIAITARQDTVVHMATVSTQKGINPDGWEPVKNLSFIYTSQGRKRLNVYRRKMAKGEHLKIPQGNWSGGILLMPQETAEQ